MRAVGADVDLFAQQQMTSSPRVRISGRGGAPIEFSLNIEGKIDRRFKGLLEVTAIGSRLEPIVKIDLESAVAAVVAAEMPRDTPAEALKAMAVLARSYYVAGGRRHGNYDFCDTTHCQWRRETIADSHPAMMAVQATAGIVVLYKDRPFAPMYHASCGGRTNRRHRSDSNPSLTRIFRWNAKPAGARRQRGLGVFPKISPDRCWRTFPKVFVLTLLVNSAGIRSRATLSKRPRMVTRLLSKAGVKAMALEYASVELWLSRQRGRSSVPCWKRIYRRLVRAPFPKAYFPSDS